MEVTVNGKTLLLDTGNESTFGGVMRLVYKTVVDERNVVTHIAVNGEAISEEREGVLDALPKEDISSIEIKTRHPLELADESMRTGLEYLTKLMEALRKNARSLRLKDSLPVEDDFQACVEGLHWFFQLIQALKGPLHIVGNEPVTEGKTFTQAEQESVSAIHELCDARDKADVIALSDAIEYELIPCLDVWRQWLLKKTDLEVALRELEKKAPTKSG